MQKVSSFQLLNNSSTLGHMSRSDGECVCEWSSWQYSKPLPMLLLWGITGGLSPRYTMSFFELILLLVYLSPSNSIPFCLVLRDFALHWGNIILTLFICRILPTMFYTCPLLDPMFKGTFECIVKYMGVSLLGLTQRCFLSITVALTM